MRLTPKQRRFAEALSRDPNRNQTLAAQAAGCGKGAAVTASKWLRLAKVQTYLVTLREDAETSAAAETADTVATLREILEGLTAIMRTNLGDYIRINPLGKVELDMAAVAAAPVGALRVRFNPGKGSWSIESHAARALHTLCEYHFGRPQKTKGKLQGG